VLSGIPPEPIRVSPEDLRTLTVRVLTALELPEGDAGRIADCLVQVDLRGIFTHGTRRLATYVKQYDDNALNRRPHIEFVVDEAAAVVVDGDGGLGYLAAWPAVERLLDKAEAAGVAVAATRFHGHVGSLGIYARRALERSLVTISTAGGRDWQAPDDPQATVWDAMKSPPFCIALPAADGAPLVVDMSANFFRDRGKLEAAQRQYPEAVVKSLGLKFAATLLGGMLAGQMGESPRTARYPAAVRGFWMMAMRPDLIADAENFRAQVTQIIAASRQLQPLAGFDSAEVAGSPEWRREREWVSAGIPLGKDHRAQLEQLASRFGVSVPW
jgi:LDH2 family malate/lactate/ureidoglycolate dehydrogenase